MQRTILASFVLFSIFSIYGFLPNQQDTANLSILNREKQPVTQITDAIRSRSRSRSLTPLQNNKKLISTLVTILP